MNIEEIEKELNELKKRSLLCFETLGFQQLRQENMESVLKGNVAKGFDLILKRDIAISRNDNKFFGDGIFQQDLAKLKNDIYRKLFSEGEKDVFERSKMIIDVTEWQGLKDEIARVKDPKPDSDNVATAKSGDDTLIHIYCPSCYFDWSYRLKNKVVISRELFNDIYEYVFDDEAKSMKQENRIREKLKEVENK